MCPYERQITPMFTADGSGNAFGESMSSIDTFYTAAMVKQPTTHPRFLIHKPFDAKAGATLDELSYYPLFEQSTSRSGTVSVVYEAHRVKKYRTKAE